jgi:hypothetical protein
LLLFEKFDDVSLLPDNNTPHRKICQVAENYCFSHSHLGIPDCLMMLLSVRGSIDLLP